MTSRRLLWLVIAYTLVGAATEFGRLLIASDGFHHAVAKYFNLETTVAAGPVSSRRGDGAAPTRRSGTAEPGSHTTLDASPGTAVCRDSPNVGWTHSSGEAAMIWRCVGTSYFAFWCTPSGIILISDRDNMVERLTLLYHYFQYDSQLYGQFTGYYYSYSISRQLFYSLQDVPSVLFTTSAARRMHLDLENLKYLSKIYLPACL
jgi:hypothetical protein